METGEQRVCFVFIHGDRLPKLNPQLWDAEEALKYVSLLSKLGWKL